jgi:hypothetical protein
VGRIFLAWQDCAKPHGSHLIILVIR